MQGLSNASYYIALFTNNYLKNLFKDVNLQVKGQYVFPSQANSTYQINDGGYRPSYEIYRDTNEP